MLPRATRVEHPRFFGYVPAPGSFASALGDLMAAFANPFVGTWLGGASMAQLDGRFRITIPNPHGAASKIEFDNVTWRAIG